MNQQTITYSEWSEAIPVHPNRFSEPEPPLLRELKKFDDDEDYDLETERFLDLLMNPLSTLF